MLSIVISLVPSSIGMSGAAIGEAWNNGEQVDVIGTCECPTASALCARSVLRVFGLYHTKESDHCVIVLCMCVYDK